MWWHGNGFFSRQVERRPHQLFWLCSGDTSISHFPGKHQSLPFLPPPHRRTPVDRPHPLQKTARFQLIIGRSSLAYPALSHTYKQKMKKEFYPSYYYIYTRWWFISRTITHLSLIFWRSLFTIHSSPALTGCPIICTCITI